jgi:hypothetical protein
VTMIALGGSESSSILHDAMTVDYLTRRENRGLHDLAATKRVYAQQRDSLANLTSRLTQQVTELEKQKKKVENALARTGGAPTSNGITVGAGDAQAAPRNADGSWPPERCSVKDPTPTSGCITPRMLHAYQQARAAGFTHFTSCYRPSGAGEHPKGRACDFASATNGFEGIATGADKTYGDRLAAWCLANADRIAVLYVIWFKQIWLPGIGWRAYQGDGTPAGDHYNHVHLSVQ